MGRVARMLWAAAVGATSAHVGRLAARRLPTGTALDRVNHAGHTVSLVEGPLCVGAAAAASATVGAAPVVAVLGSGAFGALDDFAGDSRSKGLKGHLGALAHGEVTTGAVKIIGIGATGLVAAWAADRRSDRTRPLFDTLVGGVTIAAFANLGNLLDLRPGRALKATIVTSLPLLAARDDKAAATAAAAVGVAAALLPDDLAGRTMLGDTGANALGALVGTAYVQRSDRTGRLMALAVLAGLTLASEKVSFTKVIESTPILRELDALGRPR